MVGELLSSIDPQGSGGFRGVLDAVPHPIFVKDEETRFVIVNQTMCELMGHSSQELIGKTDYDFCPKEQADIYRRNDLRVLSTGEINENEELFTDSAGRLRTIVTRKKRLTLPAGDRVLVGCITDISDFRTAEAIVRHQAEHDALTGLANRRVFYTAINQALTEKTQRGAEYSALLLDLDRFKLVNDVHGHTAGDMVLCTISERLKGIIRSGDVVARLGGDEFGFIIETHSEPDSSTAAAVEFARRITDVVREPIEIGSARVEVGASIGVARCVADGVDAESILRAADVAMYRAKEEGRGTVRFFELAMDAEIRRQAKFETDLRTAIAAGHIVPHYQPLVKLADDRIVGFEILARWNHPEHGSVAPDDFIPVAERCGLISDLTYSLLRTACRDAQEWPDSYVLSLNVSPVQLRNLLLPLRIAEILAEYGFPANRLEVEVTETAIVSDLPAAKAVIGALRDLGVRIALDDFGTGYSSLYHLRELTFDKIKIDRSFIGSMGVNPESTKIVNAILALTRSLGLPTTAEGLENAEAVLTMVERGCEFGQGFYFGRAIPADEVTQLVGTARSKAG